MLLFALLAILQLAIAAPATFRHYKPNCTALIEESPWTITNFVHFQAQKAKKDCRSYLKFDFKDTNKGLHLNTTCKRYMPFYSNKTMDDDKAHLCEDRNVRFTYTGSSFQIVRLFEDPCIGSAPYDVVSAFGRITPNFTKTHVKDGTYITQTMAHMPITSES